MTVAESIPAAVTEKNFSSPDKYVFLVIIYLLSVVSSSIANLLGLDVQDLYRIPFLSYRWIDLSILFIVATYFYKLFYETKKSRLTETNIFLIFCFIYILFECYQLYRSWGLAYLPAQVSHFISTLSLFIVIDLFTFPIPIDRIIQFLKRLTVWGSFAIIITNFYLLFSFFTGNVIFVDLDIRAVIEVEGTKESVYTFILTCFVYAFGIYFIQSKSSYWEKILFTIAVLSILVSLVMQVFRGTLLMVVIISLYFLLTAPNAKQMIVFVFGFLIILSVGYLMFGSAMAQKGYDPLDNLITTVKHATDVDHPDWDKGRSAYQEFTINAWHQNYWIGAGYDELSNYGLPDNFHNSHNGVITSLFHRGVVGTTLILIIFSFMFIYAAKLWLILKPNKSSHSEMIKLLVLVSFLWIITYMTQEAFREKYSLSMQYLLLGLIANVYHQRIIVFSKKTIDNIKLYLNRY